MGAADRGSRWGQQIGGSRWGQQIGAVDGDGDSGWRYVVL